MDAILYRQRTSDQGTEGVFALPGGGFSCFTLELPWRDNEKNISCIPVGDYECIMYDSSRFGRTYLVKDVPGRTGILFHGGNYAGDAKMGYKSDSHGCILPGKMRAKMSGQVAVQISKATLSNIFKYTKNKDLNLMVRGIG